MCFGDKIEPVDLSKEKFEKIKITFNQKDGKEEIEFDTNTNKWDPYIKGDTTINPETKKSKNVHNAEDIENLQKEIEEKDKKINDLETKISTVEKKIQTLKNILKIDVGEQLYLEDLLKDKKNLENQEL